MQLNHILSSEQFTDISYLEKLFKLADDMERQDKAGTLQKTLAGKVVACIFYEPSTRTRLSFSSAVMKLGGGVLSVENGSETMSVVKGETLEDTIRMINAYADAIVMRHPLSGSAAKAAEVSATPIINAGDGANQHPTQALLDIYTIWKEKGKVNDSRVALVGDLLYGRTVHSQLPLFALFKNIKLVLVSPRELAMPDKWKDYMTAKGIAFEETNDLSQIPSDIDVVYATRIQKERFDSIEDYNKLKGSYVIDKKFMDRLSPSSIVMHPLPRVDEIATDVDSDHRAAYFRQPKNGLYLRMALLQEILGK